MNVSETFTGPMMGHQWTIKKTPPGPQWREMGAKEHAQTVYFKRFFAFFLVRTKYVFGAPKAPIVCRLGDRISLTVSPNKHLLFMSLSVA